MGTSAADCGASICQWPWRTTARSNLEAEAQELTWKTPGICSSVVPVPV